MNFLKIKDFGRFVEEGTTAYRIFVFFSSGAVWGKACGWGERFGEDVLVSFFPDFDLEVALEQLDIWFKEVCWFPRRIFVRELVKQPKGSNAPVLIRDKSNGEATLNQIVYENGLKYEVDFSAGYSVGLFCDQRANRQILMQQRPQKVLNCFAYTCAFSVAAASVGAQTLSIDLSTKALAQGKKNFLLNEIPLTGHRFFVDDVFSVFQRLSRRGEKYDCIILDPPTFSRSAKGTFQVERDFPELLHTALRCTTPQASLLLSTNCSSLQPANLQSMASSKARALQLPVRFSSCKTPCDILGGPCPSTLWMKLE